MHAWTTWSTVVTADRSPSAPSSQEPSAEDLQESHSGSDQPSTYGEILAEQIWTAVHELERPTGGLILSGFSAGLDVGFSVFFMAIAFSMFGADFSDVGVRIFAANLYSFGFILVILGRSELFTEHTTLAVFPVLNRRATVGQLGRLWGLVYASNLAGGVVAAIIATQVGSRLGVAETRAFGMIAEHLLRPDGGVTFASGVLAGWLMGLLSWLLASAKDTMSRIVIVWMITTGIGLAGLHHCIVGTVEVVAGVLVDPALTWSQYGGFLLWATLGNTVGGTLFVAIIKYGHAVKSR